MAKKLTTADWIIRFKNKHGNTYDYSNVVYVNNKTKVEILCRTHGSFFQLPSDHAYGRGCIKCANEIASKKLRRGNDSFIAKAIKLYDAKFDYSKVEYINQYEKVKIICPIHGEFLQTPKVHLKSKYGCPKCAETSQGKKLLNAKAKEFIIMANKTHNNKYDYTKTVYNGRHNPLTITCKIHGDFQQEAGVHLRGFGCKKCSALEQGLKTRITYTTFIEKMAKIGILENNIYCYFDNKKEQPLDHIMYYCIHCNKVVKQSIRSALQGNSHRYCKATIKNTDNVKVYIVYIKKYNIFKIGVTSRNVKNRFSGKENSIFTYINEVDVGSGDFAYKLEQHILKRTENNKIDISILKSGNTELRSFDNEVINVSTYNKFVVSSTNFIQRFKNEIMDRN